MGVFFISLVVAVFFFSFLQNYRFLGEVLSSRVEETPQKKVVRLYRSTRGIPLSLNSYVGVSVLIEVEHLALAVTGS